MNEPAKTSKRIIELDVLRGFAIVAILLLHNIEHFDLYHFPEHLPEWMKSIDQIIWDGLFFLFAGKAYAMFALLFGVTFAIQMQRQADKGKDFRGRFLWRMLLLFGFGLINSLFYQGDILTIYAVLGIALVPLSFLKDRWLLLVGVLLILLPLEWIKLWNGIQYPGQELHNPESWAYFGKMGEYIQGNSFMATAYGNLTNGKMAVILWNWENGRFFSILGLFVVGYLLGKHQKFTLTKNHGRFWKRILIAGVGLFLMFFFIQKVMVNRIESEAIIRPLNTMLSAYANDAFMFVWVALIVLLFQRPAIARILNYFTAFGRMSLSNYIIQSIIGTLIYYGYGLAWYQYTGATYGLLIGLIIMAVLGIFCKWWAARFPQGPFEIIWHKLTWIKSSR